MNIAKDLLKAGKPVIGVSASLKSPVGFLADAGYDFLLFDTQHSAVEIKELQYQLQAMKGKKAIPIIRVGANDQALICYALDIGAKGIIVPLVNSKEEIIDMISSCKYPPDGIRSNAGKRGEWGEFVDYREYMSTVNNELLIIPMIETMEALNKIDEILSVPGVDVLLVGPSDLSITLDIPLDYHNPKYRETLDYIAAACKKAGVIPGMYFIPAGQNPRDYIERGFKFFTMSWDKWATKGIKDGLESIKK